MLVRSTGRTREGHPHGGPLFFALRLALVAAVWAGCGSPGSPGEPQPNRGETAARPLAVYRELGLVAGPEEFPAVASLSTFAGPADSTYVLLGLSLPNRALRFQRDGDGFAAEYVVSLTFLRGEQRFLRAERRETVRVGSFAETSRTDESVIFQTAVAVPPGRYPIVIEAGDGRGSRNLRVEDTIQVPAYGAATTRLAEPIIVYEASGRTSQQSQPDIIVNPRHTVPYGTQLAKLYVEAYGVSEGQAVTVTVEDEEGNRIWGGDVALDNGSPELRFATFSIPSEALGVGRHWVEVRGAGLGAPARVPLLVTISDQWIVANFEELLEFLAYIADPAEIDSLRNATGADRQQAWDRFWSVRDPLPATPANEFREEFFQRVRTAAEQYAEPGGRPGWRTDRGEVHIVLGPPDQVLQRDPGPSDLGVADAIEWIYEDAPGGGLRLMFVDRNGFLRYELTPASRAAFRAAAERLRPGRQRN